MCCSWSVSVWMSCLVYQLQQEAPHPRRLTCTSEVRAHILIFSWQHLCYSSILYSWISIFLYLLLQKKNDIPVGLLFCCWSPPQRRYNPNVFVREQNGFGRNKGGLSWIASGVYSNLFYRMPGWTIVGLNEQLFTLIHLVWSGSQCWPSLNQQTGRWRGCNNPLSTLSIVLVLPASLWCLLGIQPICDLMMHQINTGRRHSGSLGNLFWVIY